MRAGLLAVALLGVVALATASADAWGNDLPRRAAGFYALDDVHAPQSGGESCGDPSHPAPLGVLVAAGAPFTDYAQLHQISVLAADGSDGCAPYEYSWRLVSKPPDAVVDLSSTSSAAPVVKVRCSRAIAAQVRELLWDIPGSCAGDVVFEIVVSDSANPPQSVSRQLRFRFDIEPLRLSPDQQEAWEALNREAEDCGALLLLGEGLASTFPESYGPGLGHASAQPLEAACGAMATVTEEVVNPRPRRDFGNAKAALFRTVQVNGGSGVNREVADSVNLIASAETAVANAARSFITAYRRAVGAARAGRTRDERVQMGLAGAAARKMCRRWSDAVVPVAAAVAALRTVMPGDVYPAPRQLAAARRFIRKRDLTRRLGDVLAKARISRSDRRALLRVIRRRLTPFAVDPLASVDRLAAFRTGPGFEFCEVSGFVDNLEAASRAK